MTNEQINHLIAARNAITDRTEDYTNNAAVWHIDTVLRDVPQGQRQDVDKLLGRYADIAIAMGDTQKYWPRHSAIVLEEMSAQHDQLDQNWKHFKGDCAL